jgi:translocation and assembly module TamB
VAWERIDLAGTWHGPLSGPSAAGHVDADGLVIGQDLRVAHLVGTLGAQGGKLDGHVTLDGVMLPGPAPRLLAADRLTIDASWHVDKPGKPLEVSAEHRLMGLKMYALTAGAGPVPQEATAALTLHDLTPFAALLHQELSGSATIDARLLRSAGKDSLTLGSEALLTGGKAGWVGLFGPHLTLKLGAALAGDEVTVQNLSLASAAATLTASGNATRAAPTVNAVAAGAPGGSTGQGGAEATLARWVKDLQVRWQIDISNLTAWSNQFAGTLSLSGKVAGTPAALDGDADLKSNLSVRGSPSGPVTADIHARNLLGSPSATLKVGGMLDAAAVDIDASLDRSDARSARLLVNRAQWKSARVAGDLTADADLAQSHGQLRLHIGRLEDFERLTGVKAAGGVDGGIEFSPARGRAQAHLELEGTHLAIGSLAGDLHLQAAGAANAMGFSVAVMLPDLYGMPAALSGAGTLDLEADVLHLASVALAYRGGELSLLAPAQLSFANGVAVDELRMGARKSVVSLSGRLAPSLDLQASLTQVDSDLIDLIAPGLVAAGRLDAELRLQGSVSAPSGYLQIDAVGLQSADDAATGLPAMDIHGRADLSEGAAAVKVIVTAGSTSKATLAGSAALDAHGPLDLKLGGKLDLGLSNPFLEARGLHGSGELTLDAAVTGSAAEPVVTGGIGLAHGALRDYAHGVNLTNIEAAVTGNESGVKIQHFSATAVSGTVGVTGQVDLLKTDIPVDLVITAKNAQPVASSIITANLDADLHVTGTARQRLDVAGTVHVNRATIDIPNSLPPDVAVLDVRRRGQAPPAPSGTPLVIGIDVTVKAPQEMLVQGRGLDAELGGEVHLTGTTDDLQASGGFELQRGWFTLAGSRLQITEGNVGFGSAGLTKRIDPTLDFTAKSTVTDATDGTVTAILHITGLADSPRFEVTSSPASLPPDQIMALLLFGVPADKLTALQAAQIGYAVASLSGVGGGGVNPLVKLQRTLGLDRLTVGTNTTTTATGAQQNSGAAIAAGRYVTKRIYVEGKQTTAGTSQVQVDVDLTKHLQLQTRLGNGAAVSTQGTTPENDPGSSIGLSYHFEY